jgi:hypothetical protein
MCLKIKRIRVIKVNLILSDVRVDESDLLVVGLLWHLVLEIRGVGVVTGDLLFLLVV